MFLEATGSCLDEVINELRNFARVSGCNYNLDKTKCIPLGKAKQDMSLLSNIENNYGDKFIINEFIALGIVAKLPKRLRGAQFQALEGGTSGGNFGYLRGVLAKYWWFRGVL